MLDTVREQWCYLPFDTITMRLPWAPSVNSLYANAKRGRIKTRTGRDFKAMVWQSIYSQKIPRRMLAHPMQISITQHARSAAGDVDNGIKIVLDVLKQCGVIADDNRQIVRRVIAEDSSRSVTPYVVVTISTM